METISRRLRRLRSKRGLTSTEIARRIAVSPSTYRAWETGRAIRGEPYVALAKALGVSLRELMTGESPGGAEIGSAFLQLKRGFEEFEAKLVSLL